MQEEGDVRKWKLQDVGRLLKDGFSAILRGQLLLRLDIGRYFIHIVYTFLLMALVIWFSLKVDSTLTSYESNQKTIKELEIEHSDMEFELRTLNRRVAIEELLREKGSEVRAPEQPATVLRK